MRACEVGLNTIECALTTNCVCYRCGGAACTGYSALVVWRKRTIRMCADCLEHEPELTTPQARERLGLSDRTWKQLPLRMNRC